MYHAARGGTLCMRTAASTSANHLYACNNAVFACVRVHGGLQVYTRLSQSHLHIHDTITHSHGNLFWISGQPEGDMQDMWCTWIRLLRNF